MQTKTDVQERNRHQTVYASLLRFSPEAIPLRQRIICRLVLLALEGSDTANPKRIGAIQDAIKFGADSPELRVEIIQDALDQLIASGKVLQTELKKRAAYYVTCQGKEEIFQVHDSAADLFAPVLAKLQIGTDPTLQSDVARRVDTSAAEVRMQRRLAEEYSDQNRLLLSEKSDLEHHAGKLSLENRVVGARLAKLLGRFGFVMSSIGIGFGVLVLLLASKWSHGLAVEPWERAFIEKTFDVIGIGGIIAASVWFLQRVNIHEALKAIILAGIVICSIKLSGFATAETLAQWQAYIDVAVFVAGGIVVLATRKKLNLTVSANSKDTDTA